MHFTCSFLLKILKRVTPKVYLLQIVAVLETCGEQLAISHRILQQGFGLQYMKDNLRKELKTFTILPLVFQRGMEKIHVLFVWVLYKLQFKVNWKHTLWNLSLLVVTLPTWLYEFRWLSAYLKPNIETSKENKWQKCVWKTSVTYFNFSHR